MAALLDCLLSCDLERLSILFQKTDVNTVIPGTDGCTPLHILAGIETVHNKNNVLSFLLDKGADPNARSYENLTPVHIAAMWNNCFELEKLLQSGGNPWLTDDENKNSFDMAADNYSYEAFQLLNIYLAEDKLNFKPVRKISRDAKSANSVSSDSPERFRNEKVENSMLHSNSTFLTANENFPLIISTADESEDHVSDVSKFLKRKCLSKCKQNKKVVAERSDFSDTSATEQDEHTNNMQLKSLNNETKCIKKIYETKCVKNLSDAKCVKKIYETKCAKNLSDTKCVKEIYETKCVKKIYKNNLNQAYVFFSTESEASESTTCNLTSSYDSNYETIIDKDDKSGIFLVETKNNDNMYSSNVTLSSVGCDWQSYHNVNNDCSTSSYCSSHSKSSVVIPDEFHQYSNSKIFQELKNLGDNPGPVLDHTREVYLHRLARLKSGCVVFCQLPKPKYCPEVYLFLENKLDITRAHTLEQNIAAEFEVESDKKWREGNQRCCFNYFLLDPRVTQNLPQRASHLTTEQTFITFLDALFYVGKGTRGRPYSHLFEAAKSLPAGTSKSDKVNHILDVWEAGLGVISLHCFHNSIPVEAYTREACIMEAVGLENLTNIKKGDFYGSCARLTTSRKRLIGISLLERALQIFLLEGERYIKPKDIQNK